MFMINKNLILKIEIKSLKKEFKQICYKKKIKNIELINPLLSLVFKRIDFIDRRKVLKLYIYLIKKYA